MPKFRCSIRLLDDEGAEYRRCKDIFVEATDKAEACRKAKTQKGIQNFGILCTISIVATQME